MSNVCKYCQKGGLTWNYNGPIKKWELLETNGNKHRCLVLSKSKEYTPKIDIKNDPKINKALKIYQKQLEQEGRVKKDYILRPFRNYKK